MWGWMIVLFKVMSLVIECVDRMCQSFLSGCVFISFFFLCFIHSVWPCCCGFLTFVCLHVGIGFPSQMVVELSVGYWA